ncbi:MAG: glycosyltransferase [Elusimicrobiota bacterium]
MMKRRILLITPRFPYPSLSGGEKWAAQLAGGLARGHEVSLFSFLNPGPAAHQAALAMRLENGTFKKVYLLPRPEGGGGAGLPALPALYWSEEAAAALAAAARETGAELAHILFSEMACYQAALPAALPVVYTEIDSSYLYPWKYYLRETAGFKGFFKAGEYFRSRFYARRHYGRFAAATFITAEDGRNIARYLACGPAAVTPNAVAPEDFARPPDFERRPGEILFLGHYPHYPNEDAALRLARVIFPAVKARLPAASLTLAGSSPTPAVDALAGLDISVPGTAADIRPFLWRAQVFAAPVRYGLGTKGKILEAFAAGLPVIASREAAAGVEGARDGVHLLAAGTDRDFAAKTALLLGDAPLRARLAAAALELVRRDYSFAGVVAAVARIYGQVLDAR